jgi:hypothetical protein
MDQIAVGDLVVIRVPVVEARSVFEPTFSSPGRERDWEVGRPAIVMDVRFRKVGAGGVKKVQILLDGELWWVSEIWVQKAEDHP